MRRRSMVLATCGLGLGLPAHALAPAALRFPRDHGAHPDFRTEWWYITGHAGSGDREFGFQVTFFRSRVESTQGMSSRFAARQLLFAHAALTDVKGRKLWHDQRIAREGFDLASAAQQDTRVHLRDWSLERSADSYHARIAGENFALDLRCQPTQPLLLQGREGLSRKGPLAEQASYYYSQPQLQVSGAITLQRQRADVAGKAWMDHEWSQEYMAPQAVGWDWIGMNLDDGSALMAFRMRKPDGSTFWGGGSFRSAQGQTNTFGPGDVEFRPQRRWTSPSSQNSYPVEWIVRTPADVYTVRAVLDNQELDSRASTGTIYWEGLSELFDGNGRKVGRGYLEMTGYGQRVRL